MWLEPARGLRLILTEDFGGVMADVLVNPAGQALVSPGQAAVTAGLGRAYIAADLRCIFGQSPKPTARCKCSAQPIS